MEAVLVEVPGIFTSVEPRDIRLVFTELDLVRLLEVDRMDAALAMLGDNVIPDKFEKRLLPGREPAPFVPEPDLRQHMDNGLFGSTIVDGEPQDDVLGTFLGVFDVDVEVAVVIEDAGVEDLEFRILLAAPRVLLH
jgi:hypothetical protein